MEHVQQTGAREPLRKSAFVNMLCSIWKEGLSEENIKSGFRATGIFPFNPDKYKKDRLDPVKLKTYTIWTNAGCPVDADNGPKLGSPKDTINDQEPWDAEEVNSGSTEIEGAFKDAENNDISVDSDNGANPATETVNDPRRLLQISSASTPAHAEIRQATSNEEEASRPPAAVPGCSHWQQSFNDVL